MAVGTALFGIALMVLTITFHVNPVEGSVVPRFLDDTFFGKWLFWILFVTCMPVWILVVPVSLLLPVSEEWAWKISCLGLLVAQGFVYFWIGRVVSVCTRKVMGNTGAPPEEFENTPSQGRRA